MVASLLGDAVKGATVKSGLSTAAPGSTASYAAMGNIYILNLRNPFKTHLSKIQKLLWLILLIILIPNLQYKLAK
jgi:hypothetical protein